MKQRFSHKKSLGQHFLTSAAVPRFMCDAANLEAGDTVFEIGPGTGVLTREILARGAKVIAIEADLRAIEVLETEFSDEIASKRLIIHHGDAREMDLEALGLRDHTYICIANIPYYLSGHLFRTMLESSCQPKTLVFLVQKEVASRIARDEKESILSLSVKVFGTPRYIKTVGKGHFNPQPAVDSAIIQVTNISRDNFVSFSMGDFFTILKCGLASKRKRLFGNLTNLYPKEQLMHSFSTLSIDENVRGEDLSLEKWLQLVTHLATHK
jgi:16S rRNA (adenine1518-N6/adenine1519-N6)-dimethyltransferase